MGYISAILSRRRQAIFSAAIAFCLATMPAGAAFANLPPSIVSLGTIQVDIYWWGIYGTVSDEDPGTCMVYFFGFLNGYSVDVSSNGDFGFLVYVPNGTSGVFEAIAVDSEYELSDPAYDGVGY